MKIIEKCKKAKVKVSCKFNIRENNAIVRIKVEELMTEKEV